MQEFYFSPPKWCCELRELFNSTVLTTNHKHIRLKLFRHSIMKPPPQSFFYLSFNTQYPNHEMRFSCQLIYDGVNPYL